MDFCSLFLLPKNFEVIVSRSRVGKMTEFWTIRDEVGLAIFDRLNFSGGLPGSSNGPEIRRKPFPI